MTEKATQGSFPKNTKEGGFAYGADQGMDHIVAAGAAGVGIQSFLVVSGGGPDAVTFAALGLPDMHDTAYVVLVGGETAGAVSVDESTKATTGFSILGGVSSEVLNVLVVGRIKDQSA